MTFEQIVERFVSYPKQLNRGAGFLARGWHVDVDSVRTARKVAKKILANKAEKPSHKMPKILLLDTETAPMQAYVWGLWKQNIAFDHTTAQWFMLCWSAKWLYSDYTYHNRLTPGEAINEDDSRIMESLWHLMDEADIIVAHNLKGADLPWINTRFILNGLKPPKPFHLIDTLEVARKQFAFSSNKLDALAMYFGIEQKMETDFDLWRKCLNGDDEALKYMQEYNIKDVDILEQVFIKLMPWIKNFPNANVLLSSDVPVCATCGSEDIELIPGEYYYTSVGKYPLYRCKKCGAISRGRKSVLKPSKVQLTSIAR